VADLYGQKPMRYEGRLNVSAGSHSYTISYPPYPINMSRTAMFRFIAISSVNTFRAVDETLRKRVVNSSQHIWCAVMSKVNHGGKEGRGM
jgi:hypothetical protein